MSIARAVGRNTVYTAIGRIAVIVVWFLLTPRVLSVLGPERFGLWSLLLVLSGSLATLDLGLGVALTRFVAELAGQGRLREVRTLVLRACALQLGLAVCLVLPCLLLRDSILRGVHVPAAWLGEARSGFTWTLVAFAAGMMSNLMIGTLQGLQRMDLAARVLVPAALALGAAVFAATGAREPLIALVQAQLGYSLVVIVATFGIIAWLGRTAPEHAHAPLSLRRVLRFGGWLQATNLLFLAHSQLDKVLLGWLVALAPVGEYELGWRGAYAVTLLPFFFLTALLPAITQRGAGADLATRQLLYRRALEPVFLLVVACGAATFALAPALLEAWLRTPPAHATFMLRCIVLAQVCSLLTGAASTMTRALERTELETHYMAIGLVLHAALSVSALALFGWRGVPIGFAVSSAIAALWFVARVERVLELPRFAESARALVPALAAGVPAAAVAVLAARLLPGAGMGRAHGLEASLLGACVFAGVFTGIYRFGFRDRAAALVERTRSLVGS